MTAITGQPAPKPQSLTQPVPGKEQAMTADALMASMNAPALPDTSAPAAAPTADALMAQVGGDAGPTVNQGPGPDQFGQEPGFIEANTPGPNVIDNTITRIQTGLAANDTEKVNFLKQKFGDKNAVIKNGDVYFRRSATEKLKRLDPATLEIINDILPDFAREIVTEVAKVPGEVIGGLVGAEHGTTAGALMGGAVGSLAGPGGTGAGIVTGGLIGAMSGASMGAAGGRLAATPVANAAADQVAEWAGVPQDPTRNKSAENAIGMAAEAILPFMGRQIAKRLPGTEAYNAAKEAGKREIVALSDQSNVVAESALRLKEAGRAATLDGAQFGFPGTEINLMGHHLNPDNALLVGTAAKHAGDPILVSAQNQLASDWSASLNNILTEIGRRNNPGPLRTAELARTVTNAVTDIDKAEGQAIGTLRAKATAELKNRRMQLNPGGQAQMQELFTIFGFKLPAGGTTWRPPSSKEIADLAAPLGLTEPGQIRNAVNVLRKLSDGTATSNPGFNIANMEELRKVVGNFAAALPGNTQAKNSFGRLAGEVRQSYRESIASGLTDNFDKAAFNSHMDQFASLRKNVAVLDGALNEESSAKAIVSQIFTGKENLEKIRAIKKIDPASFGALKSEWIGQMMDKYASPESITKMKSQSFLDALDKQYGADFVKEVLNDGPGANYQTLKDTLTVMARIEHMSGHVPGKETAVGELTGAQEKAIVNTALGGLFNSPMRMISGIASMFSSRGARMSDLEKILTRDGIDKYITDYPGRAADKAKLVDKVNTFLASSKAFRALKNSEITSRAANIATKDQAR